MKKILAVFCGGLLLSSCSTPVTTSGLNGTMGMQTNISGSALESQSRAALDRLYRLQPSAAQLAQEAEAVLVFPSITTGGVLLGGAWGDGTLYQKNRQAGFYRSIAVNYGLNLGLARHGYAVFLMNPQVVQRLKRSGGWEVGAEPSLTVIDKGQAKVLSTTTAQNGVYAFVFDHKGLMAGYKFSGTKITRIKVQP